MSKRTKDELTIEAAQLRMIVDKLEQDDAKLRTELSKSLGAPPKYDRYNDKTETVYTWFEIFREIGKLLERKSQENLEDEVFQNRDRLMRLEERVRDLEPKDSPFPRP